MRKKYLSALLFGALLVTSAGTFTSCKDYDDDINNLQEQITANADAIKKLQEMIGDGKFVTGVTAENNGLKITWNDGQSTVIENVINGEDQKGDVVTINKETGEIVINGEGTGFFATTGEEETPEEVKLPYVNDEGVLVLVDAEGKEVVTGIRVAPVTAVVNEDGSAEITIIGADGKSQTVKVPSAASSITSITFANNKVTNPTDANDEGGNRIPSDESIFLSQEEFKFNRNNTTLLAKASDWKGPKALPADGDYIISSPSKMSIRLNPVSVDASNIDFYLTNTKSVDLSRIVFKAEADNGTDADGNPLKPGDAAGRATHPSNGLWTLSMDNIVVKKDTYGDVSKGICKSIDDAENGEYAYAVNANHRTRSTYSLTVTQIAPYVFDQLVFTQGNNEKSTRDLTDQDLDLKAKVGVPVKVSGSRDCALYDLYLEVAKEDAKFNVTFDQENHTFTIGQNPDWDTRNVKLPIIVWSVDNTGKIYKTVVKLSLDIEYNTSSEYQPVTHNVAVAPGADNVEYFDLQTMKDGFKSQDDLDSWIKNVNLSGTSYEVFTDEACTDANKVSSTGKLDFAIVSEKKTNANVVQTGEKGASANFVRMMIDNTAADDLKLDKQYYVKVTFRDGASNTGTDVFNSIVIPVTFTAPTVAEQFSISTNYQNGTANSIKAFYNIWEGTDKDNINLVTYFKSYDKSATLSLDNETNITKYNGVDKKSADLADLTNNKVETGYITLDDGLKLNDGTNREAGYGQALKVNVVNTNYTDTEWAYSNEADTKYSFTISVFSPIFEGTIAATDGSKNLTVIANSETGSDITADMVKLTDYANNKYNVVPDLSGRASNAEDNTTDIWSAKQIENVWVEETGDNNYIKEIKLRGLQVAGENVIPGAITVIAQPVPSYTEPTEVTVNVKDVWGYVTSQPLNITLTPNSEN